MRDAKFYVPNDVKKAATVGLRLVKEGRGGKGLTRGAIKRAELLASGAPLDLQGDYSAERMRDWFARHASDYRRGWENPPTPGYVAWMLWGGDAGKEYVDEIIRSQMPEKLIRIRRAKR